MSNLKIYNAMRNVPTEAQKTIQGGRMNGKTDINPMWRIKALTEQFGACGIGWCYTITKQWTEPYSDGQVAAFVNIELRIKDGDKWSEPIPGTGGNMFAAKEKNGMFVSDECYKMALTDAISVACKALGCGADIYWGADRTKYDKQQDDAALPKDMPQEKAPAKQSPSPSKQADTVTKSRADQIRAYQARRKVDDIGVKAAMDDLKSRGLIVDKKTGEMTPAEFMKLMKELENFGSGAA